MIIQWLWYSAITSLTLVATWLHHLSEHVPNALVRIRQSALRLRLHCDGSSAMRSPLGLARDSGSRASRWWAVQIEETQGEAEPVFSHLPMAMPDSSPLNDVPCGQCPVIAECVEGNDISPSTCKYMQAWLDF